MLGAKSFLWWDRAVIPGQVVIFWRVPFALVLSFGDLFCHRFSLTQVRGLWRRKHANQAEHEKAPSKRGSIGPDVERSAHGGHGAEGLKPMITSFKSLPLCILSLIHI